MDKKISKIKNIFGLVLYNNMLKTNIKIKLLKILSAGIKTSFEKIGIKLVTNS